MQHEQALRLALSSENNPGTKDTSAMWAGRWRNQIGSSMTLAVSGNDLTGEYESFNSAVGAGGSVRGPLKGFVKGDLISFVVLWPGGSQTAWCGQLVDDSSSPRIKTLWHLVTDVRDADEPKKLWTSTLAGGDEFTR